MPYEDERAGLAAIRAMADRGIVDEFREQLAEPSSGPMPALPPFESYSGEGKSRDRVLAIDGSFVYERIPGSLPSTEAGLVSLGMVIIDTKKLRTLDRLPESRAVNPRSLKATEKPETFGTMLPGRNARKSDGTEPRLWFREVMNNELERANFGGESLAATLSALLRDERTIECPKSDCSEQVELPNPGEVRTCPACSGPVLLADGLRIHTQFIEEQSARECHARFHDALQILALMNALRYLVGTKEGRESIGAVAFVMDGPLAAFGTIAVIAAGVRKELSIIQQQLNDEDSAASLLVMSGVKSGAFVDHAAELDRAPEPGKRIPPGRVWLPDNEYIRAHIVAGSSEQSSPWGELTYFGRPVVLKTSGSQRLVLNLAQPEAGLPLTNALPPRVLDDAIATADILGMGAHQFLPLRRAHAHAAIPLRAGTDLIKRPSLVKREQGEAGWGSQAWRRDTAAGRWYGLGRWYAMFPPTFARDAILNLTRPGEMVLDPFCGRGNAPFAATVLGRAAHGIDIHPLAWLWTEVKLRPDPQVDRVLNRLQSIARAARCTDRNGRSRFERMAWAPGVRAFLRAARRELDWRSSVTDRTLMAFVALHMQDKIGTGLSNQLAPTIAYSPSYAVKWWTRANLARAPNVDPVEFLTGRITRRYRYGVPEQAPGTALLGDARETLHGIPFLNAGLLVTSPPYRGVTDYWNDHWIRLWLLGYGMRKNWQRSARYEGAEDYRRLLAGVFREAQHHLGCGAAVLVRCDQRRQTASICADVLRETWPRRQLFVRTTEAPRDGVSSLHGRGGSKAKELDLLMPGNRGTSWRSERGFGPSALLA